jgi:hypothetical protein
MAEAVGTLKRVTTVLKVLIELLIHAKGIAVTVHARMESAHAAPVTHDNGACDARRSMILDIPLQPLTDSRRTNKQPAANAPECGSLTDVICLETCTSEQLNCIANAGYDMRT